MLNRTRSSFTYDIQLSDGSCFKIWDQVQAEGRVMPWLPTGNGSLCLEENHQQVHRRMKLRLFTSLTQVCISPLLFYRTASKFVNPEHIKYPKTDPNAVKPGEKTTQLTRKPSAGPTSSEHPPRPSSAAGNAAILRNRLQTLKSCVVQYLRQIRAGNAPVRMVSQPV